MLQKRASGIACIVFLFSCLFISVPVQASTAEDLYDFYDEDYNSDVPVDVLETINSYQSSLKFLTMYRYVATSSYDIDYLVQKESDTREELRHISNKLKNAYNLTREEIYSLENEYKETLRVYEDLSKSLVSYKINNPLNTNYDTPSFEEYQKALAIKATYTAQANIGNLKNLKAPFVSASIVDDYTDTSVSFHVANGASVTALFNGVIKSVTDNSLELDCYNNITVVYEGLVPSLKVGSTIYQGGIIGTTSGNIKVTLKLNGKSVNLYSLLYEVNDDEEI